jgi:hypothetical protein
MEEKRAEMPPALFPGLALSREEAESSGISSGGCGEKDGGLYGGDSSSVPAETARK